MSMPCCGCSAPSHQPSCQRELPEDDPSPNAPPPGGSQQQADEEACWICLEGGGGLGRACSCPRLVHSACLARWQLQSAGRSEEHTCRFCGHQLQNWKQALLPADAAALAAPPVMAICFEGQVYRIQIQPGPEGQAHFQQQVRELLQLEEDEEFDVEFSCKVPDSGGSMLQLEGLAAFDAASACAAAAAAERQRRSQNVSLAAA